MIRASSPLLLLLLGTLLPGSGPIAAAAEQQHQHQHGTTDRNAMWQAALKRRQLATNAIFDAHGRLWLAEVAAGHLTVRHSDDYGVTFSPAVTVNAEPQQIAGDGENRPKLAFGKEGTLYVSYTESLAAPFSGNVRFSRSDDGGAHFTTPVIVNDNRDTISHRFESMSIAPDGTLWLAWLDKRDAKSTPGYRGAALYSAYSKDGGATFSANRKVADHTCECCRTAMALNAKGSPIVIWRHIYGENSRDHAMAQLDTPMAPRRISDDEWHVDACPHHGPALAIGSDNRYHFAWFNDAPERRGLFYRYSRDGGKNLSQPLPFGNYERQAAHPSLLTLGKQVWLAWKEFDGEETTIRLMVSQDGGEQWGSARSVATTRDASDNPLLLSDGKRPFLSWNSAAEGYRLISLEQP